MEDDDTYAEEFKGSLNGKPVYVKFLKDKLPSVRNTRLSQKLILRHVIIQRQLNHPNIVPFLGLSEQVVSGVSGIYSISLWLNNQNLIDFVEWYPRHDKFKPICEIVEAINYIHHFNPPIIHGDINGWRIIVSDKYTCYLSGFRFARVDGIDGIRDHLENAFTRRGVYYLAPEYVDEMAREAQLHRPADIFSLACTIYQIYTGKSPFANIEVDNTPLVVRSGWRPTIPPPGHWTVQELQLWSLVDLCWGQDPDGRPTIQEISSMLLNIKTHHDILTC
ncbi:kinase-like domain-containing protein [Crucibulum laeve]|uniref:Kinase-like domain-containing protein n=1 Tax=Crucibulum laeve TaxID=68775 RepID=A0A5C3M6A7_9AGAR|nr:kinase-like domain-containing protein [Crucibulum laeve]